MLIISKISTIFIMIAAGFIAAKLKILPLESNKYMISLLLNLATPCMLITSISERQLTAELYEMSFTTIIGSFLFFGGALAVAYMIAKAFHMPSEDMGIYISIMNLINSGFMGFPVAQATFGDDVLYLMALCNMVLCVWSFTVGFFQITIGVRKFSLDTIKKNGKSMLNPCAISSIIGVIMLFTKVHLPSLLFIPMETLGEISIPLSMLVVGIQLSNSHFYEIIVKRDLFISAFAKEVIMPFLTFAAVFFLPLNHMVKITLVLSAVMPTAVALVSVASLEDRNATLASEGVALTTLFSVIAIPVTIFILQLVFPL